MSKVVKYDLALPVTVRKYEVNIDELRTLLREARKSSGLTIRKISEKVGRPITEVEHWFRTDDCFSIPDKDVWYELKSIIGITSDEFDDAVTEFIEKPGVFEKANRFYDIDGIAPTLTSTTADEKIIIDESLTKGSDNLTKTNEKVYETKPFNYVSLFSGIGGFEQALNKLGGTCVLASEIDKFAEKTYQTLYGHSTVGDITQINAEDVPDHDVIVGGFPCQSFSVAGKRGGFEDARGTLFFEMARIAKEKQPKVFLAENVKGLIGHDKGRTLDTIVKTLNEIGYRVDFDVLNSKYFGVPQNRERIFIVGIREDLVENEPWVIEGKTVVPKGKRRISEYDDVKTFNFDWPEQGEVTTRLRDILEPEVDEKYYLSEDKTAKLVAQLEGERFDAKDNPDMVGHVDIKGHDAVKRAYSVESIGPTLTTMGGGHREPKIAERHSLDAGMQEGSTKVREDGLSSTLTASYYKGLCGQGRPFVGEPRAKYRIRKLTPKECFRLQGFPDEAHQALVDAGISDSQRYKQAGNAVTVNVIEAIGEKILPYL